MKRLNISLIVGLFLLIFTACNGNSEEAMPMTQENMSEYVQQVSEATKSINMSVSMASKTKQGFKKPLEKMGYDFDATVVNMTKVFADAKLTDFTQITAEMAKIHDQILYAIQQQPEQLVTESFISEETKNKILAYLHFREIKPETIQALQYVGECQKSNGGICAIRQYVDIIIDKKFVSPVNDEDRKNFQNLSSSILFKKGNYDLQFRFSSLFDRKVNYMEFGKYLVYQNGDKVNANGFIEDWRKPFKLKDVAIKELNSYDPWWIN